MNEIKTAVITINGKEIESWTPRTVTEFLKEKKLEPKMVVVEHNGEIISRDAYETTMLNPGDSVEIVQMMAGG